MSCFGHNTEIELPHIDKYNAEKVLKLHHSHCARQQELDGGSWYFLPSYFERVSTLPEPTPYYSERFELRFYIYFR